MITKEGNLNLVKVPLTSRIELIKGKEPRETLSDMYNRLDPKPDILINAGFFNMTDGKPVAALVYNNKIERSFGMGRYMFYRKNGKVDISKQPDLNTLEWGVESAPSLLPFDDSYMDKNIVYGAHPRTAIGLNDNELIIIVTDNRPYGITTPNLAHEFKRLGATKALNLDGGGSSELLVNGKRVTGENRAVDNAIAVYLDKVLIINDGGHGGSDQGAQAFGQQEKEWTLEASLYVNQRLLDHGISSTVTRDKDITLDSTPRTDIVKNSGAKICLSHHFNAYNGKASGAEFIHSIYANGKFEESLKEEFSKVGMPTRRVFTRTLKNNPKRDFYYMHRETGAVRTTIIEYGFLDNQNDFNFLKVKENRIKLYEAVVKTVCSEQNIPYKPISNCEDTNTLKEKINGLEKELESQNLILDKIKTLLS